MTTTVIPLGDTRDTTYTVQTATVTDGECSQAHGDCGKPGVIAVRNTIEQQRPTESSAVVITMCAKHRDGATRMHELWVTDARKLQDPDERESFLALANA